MNRKERIIKNLIRITAILIFAAPCAVYLILIRRRAGDALLYTAPYQWWIIALALAAGLFSYIILRREIPSGDGMDGMDGGDEEIYYGEGSPGDNAEGGGAAPAADIPAIAPDEYPEFFGENEAGAVPETETEADAPSHDMSADISAAISMQKSAPTVTDSVETDADRTWEEFVGDAKKEEFTYDRELYDNIPDLPEDYVIRTPEEEEEAEYSLNYTIRRFRLGESVLSKVICVLSAAVISFGAAYAASLSCYTETETGFSANGVEYQYSSVESYTVSQKLLGSLSVEVTTGDGRKTELFPATLFQGEKFSENYDSIYAYMAHAVRTMRNSGAKENIEDREEIITSFRDSEDGELKYIEEIIGEIIK